jgi:hypothetical protein
MMFVSKGEEAVSGMIIIIGVLLLTLMTVGIGMAMFSGLNPPSNEKQNLSEQQLAAKLGSLSDECWRKSGKGTEIKRIDCFRAKINSSKDLDKNKIRNRLREVPEPRLGVRPGLDFSKAEEVRIYFIPETKSINISKIR